jgi:hypothetical protein
MTTAWRAVVVGSAVVACAAVIVGCSSGDGASSVDRNSSIATDSTPAASDLPLVGSANSTLAGPVPFTAAEVCERLTIESVAAALGVDVTLGAPDGSSTPRCAYTYVSGGGTTSVVTVASMRPEDVGGLTGTAAFDYVADISRQVVGTVGVEEAAPAGGDAALRLVSPAINIGVLQVNGRIFTLVAPAGDTDAAGIDALIQAMATSLT